MIRLEQISKSFGKIQALSKLSVAFPKSRITIIAGADGSGKSTILRIMLGLVKADSGKIFLKDDLIKNDFSKITGISGYMPERFSLYTDLTVEENLNFFADINNVPSQRKERLKNTLLEKTGMIKFRNRKAGDLSGGMKQKLSLSTILLSSPEIIILDEPTTGVDPLSRIEFFRIIESLKDEGKTIIISTPYLDEAESGDFIIFLKNGKLLKRGGINDLKDNVPFKLIRLIPENNIFDVMNDLKKRGDVHKNFFIKGKYLNFIGDPGSSILKGIRGSEVSEEKPGLEDIYMYYERKGIFENSDGSI